MSRRNCSTLLLLTAEIITTGLGLASLARLTLAVAATNFTR